MLIFKDLLCLPFILSGCDQLVVIAGPTYTQRLWCIMEIFTFLHMGGDMHSITILPISEAGQDDQEAQSMFVGVDVGASKCSLEHDKEKLLGIIEEGIF